MRQCLKFAAGIALLAGVCFACYRHPAADSFDRLIYEAIVLGKSQPIEAVYDIVKHESLRAEASSTLDSPQHLRELEPLYAIRPLYVQLVWWLSFVMPLRRAIDLLSAVSYFGIGVVALHWTRRPLLTGLFMAAYPLLVLARVGTPDALAALLAISGLWLIEQKNLRAAGLLCLFVSLAARTDNVLLLLAVLAWLAWERRLSYLPAVGLAVLSMAFVSAINYWAHNYGWIVLFRYSFVAAAGSPAQVSHALTFREYSSALVHGAAAIAVHVAMWILLGILVWMRRPSSLLVVVAAAATSHFLMFPSPEDRYFVWAYIVIGIMMIRSFTMPIADPPVFPSPWVTPSSV